MDESIETESNEFQQLIAELQNEGIQPALALMSTAMEAYRDHINTGAIGSINLAVTIAAYSVQITPEESELLPSLLSNYGIILEARHKRTGEMADLQRAIQVTQHALDSTPEHRDRADWLSNLGNQLHCRFERNGEIVDLEQAIQALQQAIDVSPENHPNSAAFWNNLGNKLGRRYERTDEITDLHLSIQAIRQAVNSTPADHQLWPGRLNNLGYMLANRYKRTGQIDDLDEAIKLSQQAVDSTPDNHPRRVKWLVNLGNVLRRRYERTGKMYDLQRAIQAAQQAVHSNLEHDPIQAACWNGLGAALSHLYNRTGKKGDLQLAIEASQQAVSSAPIDHPDRAIYMNNLGILLTRKYEQEGEIADLDLAIQVTQESINSTFSGSTFQAGRLHNLSIGLYHQYARSDKIADLQQAIQAAQHAVDLTPDSHPDRANHMRCLGQMLGSLWDQTNETTDLEKSGDLFLRAWMSENSIPFDRIRAASRAVDVLGLLGKLKLAAKVAQDAVDLLPAVSNPSLHRGDRQHTLSCFSGLAASACSIFLRLNQPEQGLEILEKGRTVILGELINSRSDISALSQRYPGMASRFESLRNELSALPTNASQQQRKDSAAAFESCMQEIRNISGHERFLLGLSPAEMQACATEGPIIIVNVTDLGSHAILVSSRNIKSLELPKLSRLEAHKWLNKRWSASRKSRTTDNKKFKEYLIWLWDVCVKDVFIECNFRVLQSKTDLPRVWWIGTGLANSAPFHAAGDHSRGKERSAKSSSPGGNLLLATMTTTPGYFPLPGVTEEKNAILDILPNNFKWEAYDCPNTAGILGSIQHCSVAHFACHGISNSIDPSESGLIFQKRNEAGSLVEDILTVRDISELKLERSRIAFLSACSTAENRAVELRDEVIHIVSGFQVAGFVHVVGCLWPSADAVCVQIAKQFYGTLFREDGETADKEISMALHEAVKAARETEPSQPLKWAQFVHYGA